MRQERLPWWFSGKQSTCSAGDLGLIPGLRRSPEEGNGNPFHHPCLGNSMDRRAWWATVHGIAKSQHNWETNTFTFHFSILMIWVHIETKLSLSFHVTNIYGTSLVAQWLRIHLEMQEMLVQSLFGGPRIPHAVGQLSPRTFALRRKIPHKKWRSRVPQLRSEAAK